MGEENIVGNGTLQSCCGLVVLWDNLKQWLIQPRIIIIGVATVRQYSLAHSVTQFHYWGEPKPHLVRLHCKDACVCLSVCLWPNTITFKSMHKLNICKAWTPSCPLSRTVLTNARDSAHNLSGPCMCSQSSHNGWRSDWCMHSIPSWELSSLVATAQTIFAEHRLAP